MTRVNEHGQPIGEPLDWEPRQPPASVVLEGRWMRLEPLAAGHAEGLYDALCGEAHASLWTYRPDEMPTDGGDYARRIAALAADTESRTWAIVPAGSDTAAGSLSLLRIFPEQGSAEVAAVIFGPDLQRTTAATEAVVRLGEYVFEELGY
ncbi:MAG: GNAT family N-acetyltransferase, partial [Nocardioides sp.]